MSQENHRHRRAAILAGGHGTRLKTLARAIAGDERPEQFCPVIARECLVGKDPATRGSANESGPDLHHRHPSFTSASTGIIQPDDSEQQHGWIRPERSVPDLIGFIGDNLKKLQEVEK